MDARGERAGVDRRQAGAYSAGFAGAIEYVARQVGVERTEIAFYDWSGRTMEYHRAQIRQALGFGNAASPMRTR